MKERVEEVMVAAMRLQVAPELAGQRLDQILNVHAGLSRRQVRTLGQKGRLRVHNRAELGGSPRLAEGDLLEILGTDVHPEFLPEEIPLEILQEDADRLFINKPSGMCMYPGPRHPAGTLANALRGLGLPLSGLEGPLRPGIVHRLDAGTSGVIVIARTDDAHRRLGALFHDHRINRRYLAIALGTPVWDERRVEVKLAKRRQGRKAYAVCPAGKPSVTTFKVLERYRHHSLVEAIPETGRTHQIRVHLASLGHPVCGDTLYGGGAGARRAAAAVGLRRLGLHALELDCPELGFSVCAPPPSCFQRCRGLL